MMQNRAILEKCKSKRRKIQQQQEEEMIDVVNVDEDLAEEIEENIEDDGLIEFERIGNAIWHKGYRYLRVSKNKNSWRCGLDRKCPATAIVTEQNGKMKGKRNKFEHIHDPVPGEQNAKRKRCELKEQIQADPRARPSQLIAKVRGTVHDGTFMAMGSSNALRIVAHREKEKMFGNVNTAKILEMELPPTLIERNGQNILLYDSRLHRVHDRRVVLVFAHPKMLEVLKQNDCWAVDGTFKTCPRNFKQAFIIGAMVGHKVIIAAHALLQVHDRDCRPPRQLP